MASVARGSRAIERADGVGEEGHGGAGAREMVVLDRGAAAVGDGRRGVGERAEDVARDDEHLARGAVGDAQRLDGDAAERPRPRSLSTALQSRKPASMWRRCAVSPASVTERGEGAVARRVRATHAEEHGEVHGREVLRLVDEEVLVEQGVLALLQLAAEELVGAEEERVVLGIEHRAIVRADLLGVGAQALALVVGRRGVVGGLALGAIAGIEIDHGGAAIGAPAPRAADLLGAELGIGLLREGGEHAGLIGEHLGPEPEAITARVAAERGSAISSLARSLEEAEHHGCVL
jgi:hypothetical protein